MPKKNKSLNISKSFLIKSYIKNKRSSTDIGNELNCDHKTVLNYLKKYNIPSHPKSHMGGTNKGKKFTEEHKKNLRKAIHTHHVDLNHNNKEKSNLLKLSGSKHRKIHNRAYDYLVKTKQIHKYIKWFKRNYGLKD